MVARHSMIVIGALSRVTLVEEASQHRRHDRTLRYSWAVAGHDDVVDQIQPGFSRIETFPSTPMMRLYRHSRG